MSEKIIIELSQDQALILFEYLDGYEDAGDNPTAEDIVIWDIEAQLETQLEGIVSTEYQAAVSAAKQNILQLEFSF